MSGWHMYQHRNDKWILGDTRIRWKHPFYPYACWAQCTNNHSIHSDPSIKSDMGQNLQCFSHISVWELTSTNRHSWIIICDVSVKHKDWIIVYLGWNVVCQRFLCNWYQGILSLFLCLCQLISPSIHHTFSFASLLIRCNSIFCTAPCELVGWTIYSSK